MCVLSIIISGKAHNKINSIKEILFMSKRKKSKKDKVIKLTDEQYSAYIMALKDERPPMLYTVTQKGDDE